MVTLRLDGVGVRRFGILRGLEGQFGLEGAEVLDFHTVVVAAEVVDGIEKRHLCHANGRFGHVGCMCCIRHEVFFFHYGTTHHLNGIDGGLVVTEG